MALVDEELRLVASITDRATNKLEDVRDSLAEIGSLAEGVFPIDAEVRMGALDLGKLQAIESQLESIEGRYTATVNVSEGGRRPGDALDRAFGLTGGAPSGVSETGLDDIDDRLKQILVAIESNDNGSVTNVTARPDLGLGAADGGDAVGDGGRSGSSVPSGADIRRLSNVIGGTGSNPADALTFNLDDLSTGNLGALDFVADAEIDSDGIQSAIADDSSDINLRTYRKALGVAAETMEESREAASELAEADLVQSRQDRSVTRRLNQFSISMNRIYDIVAKLVPVLAVFLAAMPAVIGGVIALAGAAAAAAGALAAVGGLAAMGASLQPSGELSTETLSEQLQQIQDTFISEFAPIAAELEPLVFVFTDAVETLISGLAGSGAIASIADEFAALVTMLGEELSGAIAEALRFGEAALPLFTSLIDTVLNSGFLRDLAGFLADVLPQLAILASFIIELVPAIVQLSQGFLTAATAIIVLLTGFLRFIDIIPGGLQFLGALIGSLLIASTAASLFNTQVLIAAYNLAGRLIPAVAAASKALVTRIVTAFQLTSSAALNAAIAVGVFISVATLGLGVVVPALANRFNVLGGEIRSAADELERFGSAESRVGGLGSGVGAAQGGQMNVYRDNSRTEINARGPRAASRAADVQAYEQGQYVSETVFSDN